jgi:hypothetical protein
MRILVTSVAVLVAACESLLPKEAAISESGWSDFASAQASYDRVTPGVTDAAGLAALGLDPYKSPNISILNYADLLRRLAGNASSAADYLDPAVRDCLVERENCRAYEIDIKHVERKREGSFWLDFLNFKRTTNVTGWHFNALFVLRGERVVYKLWSGEPTIKETESVRRPLGPLQGVGESARPNIP